MSTGARVQDAEWSEELGGFSANAQHASELAKDYTTESEALIHCCPARLRPLEKPRSKPKSSALSLVLYATWVIHILCLVPLLLWTFNLPQESAGDAFHGFYSLTFAACWIFLFVDLILSLLKKSRPKNLVPTQIAKAVAWTLAFLSLPFLSHNGSDARVVQTAVACLFIVLGMLTSYGMLARVARDSRRERGIHKFHRQHDVHCQNTEASRRNLASLVVNQASSLKHSSPIILRLASWVQIQIIRARETKGLFRSAYAWSLVVLRYLAATSVSGFFLCITGRLPGEPKLRFRPGFWIFLNQPSNSGHDFYHEDAVDEKYKAVHLPRLRPLSRRHRNSSEDDVATHRLRPSPSATSLRTISATESANALPISSPSSRSASRRSNITRARRQPLGPRYLCFLTDCDTSGGKGYYTCEVEQWRSRHDGDVSPSYVFISYTRKQFYTVIMNDPSIDVANVDSQRHQVSRDKTTLTNCAVRAAKRANVPAFWIDFECVQPEEDELIEDSMQDVYRICDIVRKAHSLSIVVGPPRDPFPDQATTLTRAAEKAAWLRQWGDRLWTVPEALLSPSQHDITIHFSGSDEVERIAKRNFGARVYGYDDVDSMQQLIDHYEGSVALGPLEFISLALECLHRRQTEKRMAGDVAYVLMGLLRQRPDVRKDDSAFQAFARLSLANDSNSLLERMICLSPKRAVAPWHDLSDAWDARLWDIKPICDVAQVDDDDERSVVLGGMTGSVINWSHLELVGVVTGTSRSRTSWILLRLGAITTLQWGGILVSLLLAMYGLLLVGIMGTETNNDLQPRTDEPQPDEGSKTDYIGSLFALIWLPCSFCIWIGLLGFLMYLQKGEIVSSQARFFGCEGEPDLDVVEQRLFGSSHGEFIKQSSRARPGANQRRFTLIDSYNRVATVFWANEPPEVLMVCGRDRGMLRALLCSYDWDNQALYRQATVRLEATALEQLHTMRMVKFSVHQ